MTAMPKQAAKAHRAKAEDLCASSAVWKDIRLRTVGPRVQRRAPRGSGDPAQQAAGNTICMVNSSVQACLLDVALQPLHMRGSGFQRAAEQYDRSARHETVSSYGSAIEQSDSGAVPSGLFVAFVYAGCRRGLLLAAKAVFLEGRSRTGATLSSTSLRSKRKTP